MPTVVPLKLKQTSFSSFFKQEKDKHDSVFRDRTRQAF